MQYNYNRDIQVDTQIYKHRTFRLRFRDPRSNINFAAFNYVGQVIDTLTETIVETFDVQRDNALQQIDFVIPTERTSLLTAGDHYLYDIEETDANGDQNQYAWGYIPIYDTVTE